MTIYDLKPRFQSMLRPLAAVFYRAGLNANGVTVGAMLLSCAYGAWMWQSPQRWPYLLLPAFMLLRMALNAIDGMLAREYGQRSDLGAILNEVGDVVSDTALVLPFCALAAASVPCVLAVVYLSVLTEFIGVLGHLGGAGRRYDGPLGKSDRAFVFGLLGLLIGSGVPPAAFINAVLLAVVLLLAATVVNRTRRALSPPAPIR